MIITMNTFAVLVCLAAVAAASPQFRNQPRQTFQNERQVAILRDDRQDSGDGNFNYNFETENGISVSASGTPGSEGQSNMQGSYRFTLPDGTIAEVRYVADEFGRGAKNGELHREELPGGPPDWYIRVSLLPPCVCHLMIITMNTLIHPSRRNHRRSEIRRRVRIPRRVPLIPPPTLPAMPLSRSELLRNNGVAESPSKVGDPVSIKSSLNFLADTDEYLELSGGREGVEGGASRCPNGYIKVFSSSLQLPFLYQHHHEHLSQSNIQGSYRFTLPDGTIAEVRYIADEAGFRADSPLIPPLPPSPPTPSSRSDLLRNNGAAESPSKTRSLTEFSDFLSLWNMYLMH
ncbi:hypothetical protein C7M84_009271 [Penaeus vannamei]|uniref:Uncharacterized protein n=1 Tax=Penaeus vannamei TaxID=6689 RepID=A0A3R7P0W5_PENVA|nr:hypothetical protein C7M84_009271 [Penaeus vannamei]